MSQGLREPIAIIGMACRFPGKNDTPAKFWQSLVDGRDLTSEIPRERWNADEFHNPTREAPGGCVTRRGSFLEGIDRYDAQFWNVIPRAAKFVDPQHRVLYEIAWEAVENAGISVNARQGSNTGMFVGLWGVDYWHRIFSGDISEFIGLELVGNGQASASGYISYFMGFTGPSLSLDTACSTSLVATHLAVRHLQMGECDMAVAAAVNLCLAPETFVVLSHSLLSPDGRCKPFDASANGYSRGEGAGAVVLKRYADAVRDGDPILALIRGTAMNADGRNSGMAVPNPVTQEIVIRKALADAGVSPLDVDFIEAHGTGTRAGDPVEMKALGAVYCEGRDRETPLVIGAVKGNLGHLETASGMAGLIKAVLALQHEQIPANLHFKEPNPAIPWDELAVRIPTEPTAWPRADRPRFAGVSSFGASGTNTHLVLEEAPYAVPVPSDAGRPMHLLALSAKSEAALQAQAKSYAAFLDAHPEVAIADVCHTAGVGRSHFRARRTVVGASAAEIRERLAAPFAVRAGKTPELRAGFLFTGQGSQYAGMGAALYATSSVFRDAIDRCAAILDPKLDVPLRSILYPATGTTSPIDSTGYAQPALFAVEWALAELWRSWGITPSIVLGHSVGEYVAACVAGVFSLEDALGLVAERGRLMQALPRAGKMVAILASEARVLERLAPAQRVRIAAVNGPENVVVSGDGPAVDAVAAALAHEGVVTMELNVSHAFHSPLMEPMLDAFSRAAKSVTYAPARLPLVSNVSGEVAVTEVASADYWVDHVMRPVRFGDGVRTMARHGVTVALEIGPKPILVSLGRASVTEGAPAWVESLRPGVDDWRQMLSSLGVLYEAGADVDWRGLDRDARVKRVLLPNYPFQRQRHWIGEDDTSLSLRPPAREGSLLSAAAKLEASGTFGTDEAILVGKLLGVLQEEIDRRSQPQPRNGGGIVSDYYDALAAGVRAAGPPARDVAIEDQGVLNFVPFPEPIEGFAWPLVTAFPATYPERAQTILDAQKALRRALFRHVDWSRVKKVLDFGCGYGTDLIRLATEHPELELAGYTISAGQAAFAREDAAKRSVASRVEIFHRDSTRDEFPPHRDLVIGFEVACHIQDKHALFANVSRALNDGGLVLLADFVARTGFEIAHDATSSYLSPSDQWAAGFADHGLGVDDVVDISKNVGFFLDDPDFEAHLAQARPLLGDENVLNAIRSYDRLGHLLGEGLASYVLITARKQSALSRDDLYRANLERIDKPLLYPDVFEDDWTYAVAWTPKPRTTAPAGDAATAGSHLIVLDEGGDGRALARVIEGRGQRAIVVRLGDRFGTPADGAAAEWTIRADADDDYRRLLDAVVSEEGAALRSIVHLAGLDARVEDDASVDDLNRALFRVGGTSLHLTRAVARTSFPSAPRVWLVTRNAVAPNGGDVALAQSTVWGFGRVAGLEHPTMWGGLVDLGAEPAATAAERLFLEIEDSQGEDQIALAPEEGRAVARLVRRTVPAATIADLSPDHLYLVTGGFGALGLRAAQWLAARGAKHLVLMGRQGPSSDTARKAIRDLERSGCEVRVARGDVAEAADVERMLAEIVRGAAPLRGIVHAAGVAAGATIERMTWAELEDVVRAKVAGTWNLERATRELPLEFFVCFSSVAATWGTEGGAHYATGNAFLDGFALRGRARGRKVTSVNWGAWAGGGMAEHLLATGTGSLIGMHGLPPRESMELLGRILRTDAPQTVVARIDWSVYKEVFGLRRHWPLFDMVGRTATRARPEPAVAPSRGRRGRTIDAGSIGPYLQHRVGMLLGYADDEAIDTRAPLIDLGIDSLTAVRLRSMIKADFGVDIAVKDLIVDGSLDSLTATLQRARAKSA